MKAAVAGLVVVAANVVGFVELAPTATPLVVHTGDAPMTTEGQGLERLRWERQYRGGYVESVGETRLVGPFQEPGACTGRVVVGQALLDQTAAVIGKSIEDEMRGQSFIGAGSFRGVTGVSVRWAQLVDHAEDLWLVGAAPHGYVKVTATLAFDRIAFPLAIGLVPEVGKTLSFRVTSRASVEIDNRVAQWLSNQLGGDRLATSFARRQIDAAIISTLAPPPPLELPGGGVLRFDYCGAPVEVADGAWGALPFAVVFESGTGGVMPPHLGTPSWAPPPPGVTLALDLDLDALNALLFELWRAGYLDRELARVGLDRQFNGDPLVSELLSVRLSPVTLALPPVVTRAGDGLRLAADARVTITDAGTAVQGRVYGALSFVLDAPTRAVAVDLTAAELACEQDAHTLVPCYGNLVDAMAGRAADFHGALTSAFGELLAALFVDRHLGDPSLPAELVIHGARPSVTANGVRLVLDAKLE